MLGLTFRPVEENKEFFFSACQQKSFYYLLFLFSANLAPQVHFSFASTKQSTNSPYACAVKFRPPLIVGGNL